MGPLRRQTPVRPRQGRRCAGPLALGLVTLIGYRLAGREWSARWLLAAVETVQLYLHVWFTWTTPADGTSSAGAHAMVPGHTGPMAVAHGAIPAHDGMSVLAMFAAHAAVGFGN